MVRDGSWSSGSWKSSPWKDGPRRKATDSGKAAGEASGEAGKVLPGPAGATKVLAGPTGAHGAGGARLADLREWHVVEARCARCRHVGRLRPKQLTAFVARRPSTRGGRQLAGQARLAEIQPRFACSECGNRAGNEIALRRCAALRQGLRASPPGVQFNPPTGSLLRADPGSQFLAD